MTRLALTSTILAAFCATIAATANIASANPTFHINIGAFDSTVGSLTTSNLGFDVDGNGANDTVSEIGRIFNPVVIWDSTGSNSAGVTAQFEGWQDNNPNDLQGDNNNIPTVNDPYTVSLGWGNGPNPHQLTIANLDPTRTYTVEVFGGLETRTDLDYSMTVNGSAIQAGNMGALFTAGTPVTFNDVTVIANGTTQDGDAVSNYIQLNNDAPTSSNPITQFVRITAVPLPAPEPSTVVLVFVGSALLCVRRKRSRASTR